MITFDAAATSTDQTATPITWNQTVSGSGTGLFVGVTLYALTAPNTVTDVSYGGMAMTKVRADQLTTGTHILETSIWFLTNPPTGTNQVSVTATLGTSPHGAGVSISYNSAPGMRPAGPGAGTSATTGTGDVTLSIPTTASAAWTFAVGIKVATTAPTITADQTSRGTVSMASTGLSVMRAEDSNGTLGAGAHTVGFTLGSSAGDASYCISAAAVEEAHSLGFIISPLRPAIFKPGIGR